MSANDAVPFSSVTTFLKILLSFKLVSSEITLFVSFFVYLETRVGSTNVPPFIRDEYADATCKGVVAIP